MSKKLNCWDVMNCGREPGGCKTKDLGVCTASIEMYNDGINGGKNSGRLCWSVAGTLCDGKIQGTFADKWKPCRQCKFYKSVCAEEGSNFQIFSIV